MVGAKKVKSDGGCWHMVMGVGRKGKDLPLSY